MVVDLEEDCATPLFVPRPCLCHALVPRVSGKSTKIRSACGHLFRGAMRLCKPGETGAPIELPSDVENHVDAVFTDRLVHILDYTFEAVAYRKQHRLSRWIWLSR